MLGHRAPLNHIFDPQPTIDAAIWKITITEQQHDADESNPTATTALTADGLPTHGRCHGQRSRGGSGGGKGREGKQYNCTHCKMNTTAECGQLTGNEGQLQEQPRKSMKTCFYCAQVTTSGMNAHIQANHQSPLPPRLQRPRKTQNTGTAAIAIAGSDHVYEDHTLSTSRMHRHRNHQHGNSLHSGSNGRTHKLCRACS